MKIDWKPGILDGIRNFQKIKSLLSNKWVKVMDPLINILSTKIYVIDQISLIEDKKEKKWMESICDGNNFLFTYNNIININSNLDHEIGKFWGGCFVTVEFRVYFINFRSKINS